MNLYELHDDPKSLGYYDERTWLAVWANDQPEAESLYRRFSDSGIPADEPLACRQIEQVYPGAFTPAQEGPHVEERSEVLRELHWCVEGEVSCDTCGLYAMDEERFRVCCDCYQCPECGCCCDK